MARHSTARRRTVASVISNPRKASARKRRKAPRVLRTHSRKANPRGRRKAVRVKAHGRSKAKARSKARSKSRRRNSGPTWRVTSQSKTGLRRINGRKSRKASSRRSSSRKASLRRSSRRRNPTFKLSSKSKTGFRRVNSRRRNGSSATSGIERSLSKIPLIGGILAAALGSMPLGLAAGVSMEIPIRLSPMIAAQSWVPDFFKQNEFAYFTAISALSGGVIAAGLHMAGVKKLPLGLSVGLIPGLMTAAGAGAGYVQMRMRVMANEAGIATPEQQIASDDVIAGMGALLINSPGLGLLTASPMGMGPAYSVGNGSMGGAYGAVLVGS